MGPRTWRRHHDQYSANVVERGDGSYVAAVRNEASRLLTQLPRTFRRLQAAKAAADDLVRRVFGHRCTVEDCGNWLPWHEPLWVGPWRQPDPTTSVPAQKPPVIHRRRH